jgi:hypothetical protein
MDFATSSSQLNKPRTDINRGGQAQKDLLKEGSYAREFYDKWDKKHLGTLTANEYDDLVKDIEKLKKKYPHIEGDNFYQQVEMDRNTNIKSHRKDIIGQEYRTKIKELNKPNIKDGTYDLDTNKPVEFNGGYNVTFETSRDNFTNAEYYDKIEEVRNKCDGKVYAGKFGGAPELSFYTKDFDTAVKIMEKYNQQGIYDIDFGRTILNEKYNKETNPTNYIPEKQDIRLSDYKKQMNKTRNLKNLSDIQQYYIDLGYSKETAKRMAQEEIGKRKGGK